MIRNLLFSTQTGIVIDAVGYGDSGVDFKGEGSFAPEVLDGSWNKSIGRYYNDIDTDDNGVDFVASWWPTPGEQNRPAQPDSYLMLTGASDGNDTYPDVGNMDDFCGEVLTGNDTWELKVYDTGLGVTGLVYEWILWITLN